MLKSNVRKPKKQHKCKICGNFYTKFRSTQTVCSPDCAIELSRRQARKQRENVAKAERLANLERLKALKVRLKTRSDWLKDLQKVFNRFIRLRDDALPCISCVRYHQGKYDAGHYRSVGAAPELRFNEDNCHKQCVPCNRHKSGNAIDYRIGLVARIGVERVEFLERQDHPPLKLTVNDIKELIAVYQAKCKELT